MLLTVSSTSSKTLIFFKEYATSTALLTRSCALISYSSYTYVRRWETCSFPPHFCFHTIFPFFPILLILFSTVPHSLVLILDSLITNHNNARAISFSSISLFTTSPFSVSHIICTGRKKGA